MAGCCYCTGGGLADDGGPRFWIRAGFSRPNKNIPGCRCRQCQHRTVPGKDRRAQVVQFPWSLIHTTVMCISSCISVLDNPIRTILCVAVAPLWWWRRKKKSPTTAAKIIFVLDFRRHRIIYIYIYQHSIVSSFCYYIRTAHVRQ